MTPGVCHLWLKKEWESGGIAPEGTGGYRPTLWGKRIRTLCVILSERALSLSKGRNRNREALPSGRDLGIHKIGAE